MPFLLALHPESVIGRSIRATQTDDTHETEDVVLTCASIDTSHPHYLFCIQESPPDHPGDSGMRRLHIPHSAVAYFVEFAGDEKPPMGFRGA